MQPGIHVPERVALLLLPQQPLQGCLGPITAPLAPTAVSKRAATTVISGRQLSSITLTQYNLPTPASTSRALHRLHTYYSERESLGLQSSHETSSGTPTPTPSRVPSPRIRHRGLHRYGRASSVQQPHRLQTMKVCVACHNARLI